MSEPSHPSHFTCLSDISFVGTTSHYEPTRRGWSIYPEESSIHKGPGTNDGEAPPVFRNVEIMVEDSATGMARCQSVAIRSRLRLNARLDSPSTWRYERSVSRRHFVRLVDSGGGEG